MTFNHLVLTCQFESAHNLNMMLLPPPHMWLTSSLHFQLVLYFIWTSYADSNPILHLQNDVALASSHVGHLSAYNGTSAFFDNFLLFFLRKQLGKFWNFFPHVNSVSFLLFWEKSSPIFIYNFMFFKPCIVEQNYHLKWISQLDLHLKAWNNMHIENFGGKKP